MPENIIDGDRITRAGVNIIMSALQAYAIQASGLALDHERLAADPVIEAHTQSNLVMGRTWRRWQGQAEQLAEAIDYAPLTIERWGGGRAAAAPVGAPLSDDESGAAEPLTETWELREDVLDTRRRISIKKDEADKLVAEGLLVHRVTTNKPASATRTHTYVAAPPPAGERQYPFALRLRKARIEEVVFGLAKSEPVDDDDESGAALTPDVLRTLAHAADFMAEESTAADRGGRCSAYLHRAADAARAAAGDEADADEADAESGPVTVLALASHRLGRDAKNGGDFEEAGLPFMGGCAHCEASIAAYNAHPATDGYLRCSNCIGDLGYATVEDADRALFSDESGGSQRSAYAMVVVTDAPDAASAHARLERLSGDDDAILFIGEPWRVEPTEPDGVSFDSLACFDQHPER